MSADAPDGLAAWRAARAARRAAIADYAYEDAAPLPEQPCENCGTPYTPAPRPGGRPQRFCSRACNDAAYAARRLVNREPLPAPPNIRTLPALPEPVALGGLCVQPRAKPVWTSDDPADRKLARQICMVCSVRILYCRDWALQLPAGHTDRTVYAGMYAHERQRAKTAAARGLPLPPAGHPVRIIQLSPHRVPGPHCHRPEATPEPRTPPGPARHDPTPSPHSAAWGRSARRERTVGAKRRTTRPDDSDSGCVCLPGSPGGTVSMRLEDTPEWAGPQGESGFGTGQGNQAGAPGAGRPARDPAAEAIERTIEAERRADQFRSAPADATVVT